jgi:hypothetical protein
MVEIRQGDHDVTEGDQLTLEVRRDCDREYLRRASAFIRAKARQDVPFFIYFNHSRATRWWCSSGVKWRNFKLAFVAQQYSTDPVGKLSSPRIINLVADPQEREPLDLPYMHSWTVTHFNRLLGEFQASVEREPPVPPGAPLDFVPSEAQQDTQQPGSG